MTATEQHVFDLALALLAEPLTPEGVAIIVLALEAAN